MDCGESIDPMFDTANKKTTIYMRRFSTAVISGASSGMGEAFAKLISELNPDILIFNLSRTGMRASLKKSKIADIHCDLTVDSDIDNAVSQIKMALASNSQGGSFLLINNAGCAAYLNSAECDSKSDAAQINTVDLNVRAPVKLTDCFMREIVETSGAIINVASTAAFQPTPMMAVYGASKSFILNWSVALSAELSEFGCRVLAICPGPTRTRFFSSAGIDTERIPDKFGVSADGVALAALEALADNKKYLIVGLLNRFLITLSGLVPLRLSGTLANWVMKRRSKIADVKNAVKLRR